MKREKLLRWFGMDLLIWFSAPIVFLFLYVNRYSVSADAILPHLRLVILTILGLTVIRIVLSRLIGNPIWSRFGASVAASALLAAMLLYYVLVIIGLQSWGRIISWDLITSYAAQAPQLADALAIPLTLGLAFLGLLYFGLFTAVWFYIKNFDWAQEISQHISRWLLIVILLTGCGVIAIELYSFVAGPRTEESEPVSLTFFPLQAARQFQDTAINKLSAARYDRKEDAVRASYKVNPQADRKNVILIVVDALRPDHMGIYGYHRNTTPNLSRLALVGRLQKTTAMRSSCSESACGMLSLASSKFVHQFSERPFTLQQVLKLHGYAIHMILGGDHTHFYGLRQTYGDVDSYFDGSMAYGYYVNDDQLILDKVAALPKWNKKPVMMQFHLMSAHVLGKRHKNYIKFSPSANYSVIRSADTGGFGNSRERAVNYYDNGVLQADAVIHALLETLKEKQYLNNAIVVITADHGESLGEHGLFIHANSVREEVLRVPFLMIPYGYKQDGFLSEHIGTSQVDIAPTMLRELAMPRPETWSGFPLQESKEKEYTYFQQGFEIGLVDHRDNQNLWKYWFNTETGEEYAYNLTMDPKENVNVIEQVPLQQRRNWRLEKTRSLHGAPEAFERL